MPKKLYKRSADSRELTDEQLIQGLMHDLFVNAQRGSEVGHIISRIHGEASSAIKIGPGKQLRIWNSDTAVHYVVFGDASVGAPTGATDGIPIPPESYILLGTGEDTHVIADSATVFVYEIRDSSRLYETEEV